MFALPLLGSALLEGGLALLSDRWPRRRLAAVGLCATSLALGACAVSSSGAVLAVGLTLAGAASGLACAAAQGELVTANPAAREQAMARWVFFGALGDVLTPLVVALVLDLGGTYRAAFACVALWSLGHGLAVLRGLRSAGGRAGRSARGDRGEVAAGANGTDADADVATGATETSDAATAATETSDAASETDASEAEAAPLGVALRESIRSGRLWLALFGASLCMFLDEVVVALAALHAEADLGATAAASVACVTSVSLGSVLGAWWTERLLARTSSDRVLNGSALVTLVALALVVIAPSVPWLVLALAVLGVAAAPQYALLQAKAYAAVPGRPGVVNALANVFVVVDILGPLALGALADAHGVTVALAALAVQPLGVLLLALRGRRAGPRGGAEPPVLPSRGT